MANPRKPRKGSMAYWPRVRAAKIYPVIKSWSTHKQEKTMPLGFAGIKVGMTHLMGLDVKKTSMTKNEEIKFPVTIIECPPMRLFSVRFYKKQSYGPQVAKELRFKPTKELERKVKPGKTFAELKDLESIKLEEYSDISVVAYSQPSHAQMGKKRPDIFELKLGGSNKDKLEFVKSYMDKEVPVELIFKDGQFIDLHAVTKGKGTQGPVKRFGIGLKQHKSEKGRRQPGSRGGWSAQGHVMYRTAYSGQMGFHQRLQFNTQILKIGTKPEEINPVDGFPHYGKVKTTYLLLKGSVPGPHKRTIIMTQPLRLKKEDPLPTITHISLQSKQGN